MKRRIAVLPQAPTYANLGEAVLLISATPRAADSVIQTAQVFTDQNPAQELHCSHYKPLVYHVEHVSGCCAPDQLNCQSCPRTLAHQCLTFQQLTQACVTSEAWQRAGTVPVFWLNAWGL